MRETFSEYLVHITSVLLCCATYPDSLNPIAFYYVLVEIYGLFFGYNIESFVINTSKTSRYIWAFIKGLTILLLGVSFNNLRTDALIFITNVENSPSHRWDDLDPLLDSLRASIKYCAFVPALVVLHIFATKRCGARITNSSLNFVLKLSYGLGIWWSIHERFTLFKIVHTSFPEYLLGAIGVLYIIIELIAASFEKPQVVQKPIEEEKEKPVEEKKKTVFDEDFVFEETQTKEPSEPIFNRFIIYDISEGFKQFNLVNSDFALLVYLILLNCPSFMIMIFLIIQLFHRVKSVDNSSTVHTRFIDTKWIKILWKWISFGVLTLGYYFVDQIEVYLGEEENGLFSLSNNYIWYLLGTIAVSYVLNDILIYVKSDEWRFIKEQQTPEFKQRFNHWFLTNLGRLGILGIVSYINVTDIRGFQFSLRWALLGEFLSAVFYTIYTVQFKLFPPNFPTKSKNE